MNYSLTDLKNFHVCSNSATMMEASRLLNITQPALSESIKKLESEIGEKLFYRSRNGIELTPAGRALLPKVQGILNELKLFKSSSSEKLFGDRIIRIGAHPTVASYTLPKALKNLDKRAPDYKIEIFHAHSRDIQYEIQRGKIDIGIVVNPVKVPDLVIHPISTDEVGVWGVSSQAKLDTVFCDLDLAQTQVILKKWKLKPEKVMSTDHMDLITRLVAENLGVGILPRRAALLSSKKLHLIKSAPLIRDELTIVYRPEFGKISSEKIIIEVLKQSLS